MKIADEHPLSSFEADSLQAALLLEEEGQLTSAPENCPS
jgi:hypothetical protein